MKKYMIMLAVLLFSLGTQAAEVKRIEPAFWWVGMNNPELQILLYGDNIAANKVSIEYPGVTVKEVVGLENPNYLFLYLDIAPTTKPGTMNIVLTEGKRSTTQTFELLERDNMARAAGFSTKDVLYLIMPDRFANGNPDNDVYDNIPVSRTGGGRHGGDLQGIVSKFDYLNSLGVTAVWLNPVLYNNSGASHGYSITDFYKVDPRFGSNDEYRQMVNTAHEKGIKVVMDMIFNHSGSGHWWIYDIPSHDWFNNPSYAYILEKQAKERAEALKKNGGKAPQAQGQRQGQGQPGQQGQGNWGGMRGRNFDPNDGYVQTTHYKWALMDPHAPETEKDVLINGWFTRGMPDLNQRNRHLATYLIQNSIWWIEFANIDGIRQDTYPYADYDFMARWCREIEEEYPDFNIVGEGWYPRNTAMSWWQRNSAVNENNSCLKTVMDFDFTFTAQQQLGKVCSSKEQSEAGLFKMYEVIAQDFLFPDPNNILVFLDNHDLNRFMQPDDPIWKFKHGVTLLLTTRGIPQLYYGTEILMGQTGGRDNRADFPGGWPGDQTDAFTAQGRTPEQNEAWNFLQKVLQWRKTSAAVTEGKLIHYTPDNSACYVYAHIKDNERVLVVLNGSDESKELSMKRFSEVIGDCTKGSDILSGKTLDVTGTLTVPAREVYIMELK